MEYHKTEKTVGVEIYFLKEKHIIHRLLIHKKKRTKLI
nr:MAG TPA: steroid receptor coactivator [Caudoviricetes sp.]